MDELIRKQDVLEIKFKDGILVQEDGIYIRVDKVVEKVKALPPVQPDKKLERCLFEYINACRTATFPTPDTTKMDIRDAYAVIKALQPIFGDVPFAEVKKGEADG